MSSLTSLPRKVNSTAYLSILLILISSRSPIVFHRNGLFHKIPGNGKSICPSTISSTHKTMESSQPSPSWLAQIRRGCTESFFKKMQNSWSTSVQQNCRFKFWLYIQITLTVYWRTFGTLYWKTKRIFHRLPSTFRTGLHSQSKYLSYKSPIFSLQYKLSSALYFNLIF